MSCRCRSGLGSSFLPGNFSRCEIFAGPLFFSLTFRLLQTLRFLCPPLISLFFCSISLIGPLISLDLSFALPPTPFFPFFGFSMVKTREGSAFQPRVRRSSPSPVDCSSAPPTSAEPAAAPPTVVEPTTAPPTVAVAPLSAAQGSVAVGSSTAALSPRRYHTRVGPTPPSLPHPKPARRAPPPKRAPTSGPGESSSSRPQEPHQNPTGAPPLDLSPASIIRLPLFHCNLIPGNADCSERDLHDEVFIRFSILFHRPGALRLDAPSAEVLLGAIHDTSLVLLPSGGHRVLPHDDIQARAPPDCSSFLHRRLTWDTQGLRHRCYIQFADGPRQLGLV